MLIQGLEKIQIVSYFGNRVREGKQEFHPGIDIRVFDKKNDPNAMNIFPVVAQEAIGITEVKFDPKWGHYIKAQPVEKNEFGIIEFRYWHIAPNCQAGDLLDPDMIIGIPEAGYVSLHLHFETRNDYRGTTPIDPMPYLQSLNLT